MRLIIFLSCFALAGCAMSTAEMGKDEIDLTLTSEKAPDIVAGCIASRFMGFNESLRLSESHYLVVRKNSFGAPIVRWDIIGTDTGSRIELRSSLPVNHGTDDVRMCR